MLHYGTPNETVKKIIMIYTDTNPRLRYPADDTNFFDIVAGGGNSLASYTFIICLYYVLRTSVDTIKDNVFTLQCGPNVLSPTTKN